ncbi:DUF1439 domain-containing protein [Shewanella frigidimarina]|jgi:hypothetical protein|uniref:Lipoprotein n=1 Tax=Shewanella frigidimarina (strain NCIMB 400) TaxID=318167 RepID=Q089L4_SHEFN|nr:MULTISPECIES: DUF1439 domain-containing protein [Shewanella]ABI70051.1 protein of unknown function DUF1439 [Shewanella frigidimarina NCIMB 400]MBB1439503.1 DUF1439 domain-containing protein [Shewanella sp. SG41-4]RPA23566.1 DUF1439 domain-containing protein [Shewanella frigidimarina]HBF47900.1 DUF1439 domain-containing protein [Shewanella frigidimarina]|tara:strand:+ start:1807 stop:2346 length:540 start_codon:yes stop_codon:yes gene_type:complete
MITLVKTLGLGLLLLLTGCASQYSITESEIEQYLNKDMHFEVKQGNKLIGVSLKLNDMQVVLGAKPNTMAVTAATMITVNNPLLPIHAKLKTTFEAVPWYDSNTKSVYLRQLTLVKVESEPADIERYISQATPQLMGFLRNYLENQPVYTLDTRDSNQALMAKMTKEIAVQQGKLVVKF